MRPIVAGFILAQTVLLGSMSSGAGMLGQELLQTCELLLTEFTIAPDGRGRPHHSAQRLALPYLATASRPRDAAGASGN